LQYLFIEISRKNVRASANFTLPSTRKTSMGA
jgi:hypothetical protein